MIDKFGEKRQINAENGQRFYEHDDINHFLLYLKDVTFSCIEALLSKRCFHQENKSIGVQANRVIARPNTSLLEVTTKRGLPAAD